MNNHIVNESASKMREIARKSLAGYWKPMFVALLLIHLLTTGVGSLLSVFFSYDLSGMYANAGVELPLGTTLELGYGASLYNFIVSGPFTLGLYTLLLTFFRTKQVDNSLIFEGFGSFGKAFVLQFLITLRVFLWMLLMFIPGIIASYRYSQAFYVMADHPEYTPTQCINESKRLMAGNKWRLFCLNLSFIGWVFLASIPSTILASVASVDGIAAVITGLIAALPAIVLSEYTYMAEVAFYELLTERLVVVSDSDTEYTRTVEANYTVGENDEHSFSDEQNDDEL